MEKKAQQVINILIVFFLVIMIIYSGIKLAYTKTIVTKNEITYYLYTDQSINYAIKNAGKNKEEIYEYYSETKYWDVNKKKYKQYEIQNNYITIITEYNKENQDIVAYYIPFEKTKYENRNNKIKLYFSIDDRGYILYAKEFSKSDNQIIKYTEYYSDTKYQKGYGQYIQYIYYIDESGYIEYAIEREKITKKNVSKIYYEAKTKYDEENFSHKNKILSKEEIISEDVYENDEE